MFDNNKSKIVLAIVASVGILLFLIGIALSIKFIYLDVKGKPTTYAEIVNLSESQTAVRYNVNGRGYFKIYNAYSSSYYIGKDIKIYYDKNNPNKSTIANMRYLILIVPGLGLLFTAISGVILLIMYMNSDHYKYRNIDI